MNIKIHGIVLNQFTREASGRYPASTTLDITDLDTGEKVRVSVPAPLGEKSLKVPLNLEFSGVVHSHFTWTDKKTNQQRSGDNLNSQQYSAALDR